MDLVAASAKAISENKTQFTRTSMGDGKMKADKADDTGHKKGRQPDGTGGKPEKKKTVKDITPK